jgi:hypothetical protein
MSRHEDLAVEMQRRGYRHNSPMPFQMSLPLRVWHGQKVNRQESLEELKRRCMVCTTRCLGKGLEELDAKALERITNKAECAASLHMQQQEEVG